MSGLKDIILVTKDERSVLDNESVLTGQEAEILLEYQDVFIKFLKKSKFSYQIQLCLWTHKGKEGDLYRSMDTVAELIEWIKGIEKWFKDYMKKKEEAQEKK